MFPLCEAVEAVVRAGYMDIFEYLLANSSYVATFANVKTSPSFLDLVMTAISCKQDAMIVRLLDIIGLPPTCDASGQLKQLFVPIDQCILHDFLENALATACETNQLKWVQYFCTYFELDYDFLIRMFYACQNNNNNHIGPEGDYAPFQYLLQVVMQRKQFVGSTRYKACISLKMFLTRLMKDYFMGRWYLDYRFNVIQLNIYIRDNWNMLTDFHKLLDDEERGRLLNHNSCKINDPDFERDFQLHLTDRKQRIQKINQVYDYLLAQDIINSLSKYVSYEPSY